MKVCISSSFTNFITSLSAAKTFIGSHVEYVKFPALTSQAESITDSITLKLLEQHNIVLDVI